MLNNDYGLKDVHEKLLLLLVEFDRICRENNINYSLHGGTLLGAERNGRLIPWDDDMDISMTRENYKKLINTLDNKKQFYLDRSHYWTPRFGRAFVSKIDSVYIDIFVWDYISEKRIEQLQKIYILHILQCLFKGKKSKKKYSSFYKAFLCITWLIGIFIPRKILLKVYDSFSEHYLLGDKKFIHRSNDSFNGINFIFDSDYMLNYGFINLENNNYMVTTRYKEFLKRSYGENYIIPPNEDKRKPNHFTIRQNF